jgi:hypothetical protein
LVCGLRITHQEHKKIRRPSSGGGKFRGDFSFRRSLSRTSTRLGQGTLPSPTAGCRIRFRESLLMLTLYYAKCRVICTSFFGFAMLKKERKRGYRQVLQNRGSTNSSERGTLASVTPRARLLKLSEVPYLLKWGFKPCLQITGISRSASIWRDLPEFKFSSLLKSH